MDEEIRDEEVRPGRAGCGRVAVIMLLLLWLGAVPVGSVLLVHSAIGETAAPAVVAAATISLTGVALLAFFIGVALLTRRRAGWETTTAIAAALTVAACYLVFDAAVQATFPGDAVLIPFTSMLKMGALRLGVLIPYGILAAWLAPRLAEAAWHSLGGWLGLDGLDVPTLFLALALGALTTIPWPVTGALGDSLTSLGLAFRMLAWTVPQVLIFWGVIFRLLFSTFARPWVAALVLLFIYGVSALSGVLPGGDWGALEDGLLLLPLAFLLTELRARDRGIYSLLLVAFCYRAAPALFVDPRDVIANGIPEPQHIISHTIVVVMAAVVGLAMWGARRLLLALRGRRPIAGWIRLAVAVGAVVALWGVWGGLYVFAGQPGFSDDGFLIILEEQADLSGAYAIPDRDARLRYVRDALVETAERTQAPLRAELDGLGIPYRSYYIINMIRVDGHRWLMSRFEGRPGVAQVLLNPNVREYPRRIPIPYGGGEAPPEGVQSNLAAIHADEAWVAGVTGEGIVVAGQDTGYEWTHPALKPHYRGWDGHSVDHNYNWHDAWDDTAEPFDDDSHGTHTMGIVLGDDGRGNRTGVAPDARWIGCRNMRRGFGNPGSYAECMEFFLAPYPYGGDPLEDGDVAFAPHVVNNSWGCPDFEGCLPDTLEPAVEALQAAGIMMVVSVGNDGPACNTATTPPASYDAAFAVGATSEGGDIVSFSSRGPADGLIKPDVAAPGASVRSSVSGGGYGYASGTSMAGPHVTGVVALLWSADPGLIGDIDATEALICRTAVPKPVDSICAAGDEVPKGPFAALLVNPVCACGGVTGVPNNVYGCGFIDAGAAVRAVLGR